MLPAQQNQTKSNKGRKKYAKILDGKREHDSLPVKEFFEWNFIKYV